MKAALEEILRVVVSAAARLLDASVGSFQIDP
jgi:hypothetical protein